MNFRTAALGVFTAGAIAVSGYVYSQRSLDNLAGVHADLQKLSKCALDYTLVDFVVVDGLRSDAEHQENLAKGVSWTKRSRHQDGKAIDVAAYVNGKITYDPAYYYSISGAFYFCSEKYNIPIVTGGEWKVKDYMHIELDRKAYP